MSKDKNKNKKDDGGGKHNPQKYINLEPTYEAVTEIALSYLEERAPLSMAQRRSKSLTMRRYKTKIAMARKRAAKRKASPEKLKSRAQRKARNLIKQRLMKSKKYADMSTAEKISLDKRLQRIPKTAIDRLTKRQLPQVKKAEMERLSSRNTKKEDLEFDFLMVQINEAVMQDCDVETPKIKRYHKMFTKENGVNIDKRFKVYRKKTNSFFESKEGLDELQDLINSVSGMIEDEDNPCWDGYKKVRGKKDYEKGSCVKEDIFTLDEMFEFQFLDEESILDKALSAMHRHVLKGVDAGEIAYDISRLVKDIKLSGRQLETEYAKQYGDPKKSKKPDSQNIKKLKKKYGFKESKNPDDREWGTDSLTKIYKKDTPNEKNESSSLEKEIDRGSRVKFKKYSLTDGYHDVEGTFIGTDEKTGRMKIRDDSKKLHVVKHQNVNAI